MNKIYIYSHFSVTQEDIPNRSRTNKNIQEKVILLYFIFSKKEKKITLRAYHTDTLPSTYNKPRNDYIQNKINKLTTSLV